MLLVLVRGCGGAGCCWLVYISKPVNIFHFILLFICSLYNFPSIFKTKNNLYLFILFFVVLFFYFSPSNFIAFSRIYLNIYILNISSIFYLCHSISIMLKLLINFHPEFSKHPNPLPSHSYENIQKEELCLFSLPTPVHTYSGRTIVGGILGSPFQI